MHICRFHNCVLLPLLSSFCQQEPSDWSVVIGNLNHLKISRPLAYHKKKCWSAEAEV